MELDQVEKQTVDVLRRCDFVDHGELTKSLQEHSTAEIEEAVRDLVDQGYVAITPEWEYELVSENI